MLRSRTFLACLLALAILAPGSSMILAPTVSAQDDTGLGDAVAVTDDEGAAVGAISVAEVVDPFTEFDPAYPPEPGSRYVALNVAFDADAGARFDIAPRSIVLQDDAGFIWNPISLYLPDDALIPELSNQTLAPGSRVSGVVGFVVPEGSEPARVFYQPESSRLLDLASLTGQEPPALGDIVLIVDSEGGVGSVTVTEVADPFEDFDPAQPPPEGTRLALVTLAYENSSDGRFFVEPYGLLLRDASGDLWTATSISRIEETEIVPDLTTAQLAPGDRISGAVAFAVPADIAVDGVFTAPVSGQLIQLADLGAEAAADAGDGDATATVPDAGDGTPSAVLDEETSATIANACVGVAQWLGATQERITRAGTLSVEGASLDNLERLASHVAVYGELAEAQLAEQAPAGMDGVGKALAATLNTYAAAVEQIVGANEPGKDTVLELTEGVNTFNDAGVRLQEIEAELETVAADCGLV